MKKQIKKITFWFFVFFLCSLVSAFAEFEDADEDLIMDEEWSRGNKEDKEKRERQKKTQLQQWLKQLAALKGNKKEAPVLALTTKILNKDPDNAQALNALGAFYLQSGKTQLAQIIFTRALKKHPRNSSLHNNLAVIALKGGKKERGNGGFSKKSWLSV